MKQSDLYIYYIGIVTFLAFITLGGLGNIALKESFYWIPFLLNLGFYSIVGYKLFKKKKEFDKEGK